MAAPESAQGTLGPKNLTQTESPSMPFPVVMESSLLWLEPALGLPGEVNPGSDFPCVTLSPGSVCKGYNV